MDFLSNKRKLDKEEEIEEEEPVDEDEINEFFERYPLTNAETLPKVEERILYHLSGHTIFSAIKLRLKQCPDCLPLAMTKGYSIDVSKYQKLKDYTGEALIECDQKLFETFFLPAELLFRKFLADDIARKKNILEKLLKCFLRDDRENFFPCHNFDEALAKRFFTIR